MIIETLADLLTVAKQVETDMAQRPWWRGQARADWPLIAAVHRVTDRGAYERGITLQFQGRAPSRHPNCPPLADTAAWLNLMQHHGLPTRLLDWTESALFALHFAVREREFDSEDACIWALDPFRMNELHFGQLGTLASTDNEIQPLLWLFRQDGELPAKGQDVAALTPTHVDLRNQVQVSVFTIHATPRPLEECENAIVFLRKVTIPSTAKSSLRKSLRRLCVTDSYLFPDLTHLAQEQKASCFCLRRPCPHREDF